MFPSEFQPKVLWVAFSSQQETIINLQNIQKIWILN